MYVYARYCGSGDVCTHLLKMRNAELIVVLLIFFFIPGHTRQVGPTLIYFNYHNPYQWLYCQCLYKRSMETSSPQGLPWQSPCLMVGNGPTSSDSRTQGSSCSRKWPHTYCMALWISGPRISSKLPALPLRVCPPTTPLCCEQHNSVLSHCPLPCPAHSFSGLPCLWQSLRGIQRWLCPFGNPSNKDP